MKATDHFKSVIQSYLEQRAEYDELFAVSFRNPLKNLEDCILCIPFHNIQSSLFLLALARLGVKSLSCPALCHKYDTIACLKCVDTFIGLVFSKWLLE